MKANRSQTLFEIHERHCEQLILNFKMYVFLKIRLIFGADPLKLG